MAHDLICLLVVHAHEATRALMRCALVVVRESVCLFMVHVHEAT